MVSPAVGDANITFIQIAIEVASTFLKAQRAQRSTIEPNPIVEVLEITP